MCTYRIKSSTLNRIAGICSFFDSTTSENLKAKINTVRLENKNGHSFAIASNQKIGAVEYLGTTKAEDSATHLILSPNLLEQIFLESLSEYVINIITIPMLAVSTLQSSSNYSISDCCYWWDDTPLKDWRDWGCEPPRQSKGIMYWNLFQIEALIKSSPSGKVIFPEFIDSEFPITLRDFHDPKWVGLFIPEPPAPDKIKTPAALPDWWNV